jgi:hypothetical protein
MPSMTRKPLPGQTSLFDDPLLAPDPSAPEGGEQPSMLGLIPQSTSEHPFEACDECGLDIHQLHHEECGDCYCDGNPCSYEDEGPA